MIIRREDARDIAAVRTLVEAAFPTPAEARLIDRLRSDGDAMIALVGVELGTVVGHVLLSRMVAPFRALGLAPVAVAPSRQREGIGSALIHAALREAGKDGWQGVFVLGDPAFYCRFGFASALASGFTSVYAGPYLMALALDPPLPVTTGMIDYAPAFAALDGDG